MASKADFSLLISIINTSSTKQASQKRSPIYKHSRELDKGELIYNLKKRKYIYYKYCMYGTILITNLQNQIIYTKRVILKVVQIVKEQKKRFLYIAR